MPSSRTFLALAIALLLASAFGYGQTWAIFTFLLGFVAIVVAILARPRERRARLVASLAGFGSDWGPEIGPAPGEVGPIIPTEHHPAKIMRAYPGQNEFEIRTRRAADQAALALRGYVPIGENRPGGTMTVTYERQSAGGTGVAGTPSTADDLVRRPAERLRSLDHLRDQGLISVDEWASRRRLILAEI